MPFARKLSEQDKEEIRRLRDEGETLQEIADSFGVTRERVRQLICLHPNRPKRTKAVYRKSLHEQIIYPNIREWCQEQNISFRKLGKALCMSDIGIRQFLTGNRGGTKKTIDAILGLTGMTYEEAFRT